MGAIEESGLYPIQPPLSGRSGPVGVYMRLENNYIPEEAIQESVQNGAIRPWVKTAGNHRGGEGCAKVDLIVRSDTHFQQRSGEPPAPENAPPPKQVFDRNAPQQQRQGQRMAIGDGSNSWNQKGGGKGWQQQHGAGKGWQQQHGKGWQQQALPGETWHLNKGGQGWQNQHGGKGWAVNKGGGENWQEHPFHQNSQPWQLEKGGGQQVGKGGRWRNSHWDEEQPEDPRGPQSHIRSQAWEVEQPEENQGASQPIGGAWQQQHKPHHVRSPFAPGGKSSGGKGGNDRQNGATPTVRPGLTAIGGKPSLILPTTRAGSWTKGRGNSQDRSRTPSARYPAPPAAKPVALPHPWEEHWSEQYSIPYYWNAETGESLWEKPSK